MAVSVVGSVSPINGEGPDPATLDGNHTIPSGQSNVLLVGAGHLQRSSATIDTMTWDPAGANEALVEAIESAVSNPHSALGYKHNPSNQDGAAYTLRFTFSLTTRCGGAGINFAGVDSGTPISNAVTEGSATSGSPNVTVTTAADADDLVIDAVTKVQNSSLTVDGSQLERWNFDNDGIMWAGGSTEAGGTSPTEMDWSFTGTDNGWSSVGMLVNAAAEAPEAIPPGMIAGAS